MENTPARIAADILIAAIEVKGVYKDGSTSSAVDIVDVFNTIHAAVHEAAKKDYDANLFKAHS